MNLRGTPIHVIHFSFFSLSKGRSSFRMADYPNKWSTFSNPVIKDHFIQLVVEIETGRVVAGTEQLGCSGIAQ